MCRNTAMYCAMPLRTGSQNVLASTDQTLPGSVSKINLKKSYVKYSPVGKESKNVFTLDPSDTWRLFISGKDTSKLDVPILKWWGSAEVVSHDVESESIWFVSSDGERVIICLKDNAGTEELSIQPSHHTLLLRTCKVDIILFAPGLHQIAPGLEETKSLAYLETKPNPFLNCKFTTY